MSCGAKRAMSSKLNSRCHELVSWSFTLRSYPTASLNSRCHELASWSFTLRSYPTASLNSRCHELASWSFTLTATLACQRESPRAKLAASWKFVPADCSCHHNHPRRKAGAFVPILFVLIEPRGASRWQLNDPLGRAKIEKLIGDPFAGRVEVMELAALKSLTDVASD